MQLVATHIHSVDPPSATREQNFGETPGRGADIETDAPARVTDRIAAEMIECGRELYAAARHVGVCGLGLQDRGGWHFLRGSGDVDVICRHLAGSNRCLGLGTALEQAAL